MKVFILDTCSGAGLDFAIRCQMAGHDVRWYSNVIGSKTGSGLIKRVPEWQPSMKWADLIFMTDNTKYHRELQKFFDEGYPIFGCNPQSARLELDREYGQDVLSRCGIPVPPYKVFSDYGEAEDFVRYTKGRYVSKPCGDEEDKSLSYVSKTPADMIYMLNRWKKAGKLKSKFMLQEFIGGIEMGVSGWFGPGGFLGVWEENFEHKKLMNDDKGVNTGEMGTAIKYVKESKLAEEILKPIEGVLHGLNYVGDCDLNVIIDPKGNVWPLEFTIRPGWPSFYIQESLHQGDPVEWMKACLEGEDILKVDRRHAIGVVMAIPDFPYSKFTRKEVEGVPIYGINGDNIRHVHLGDVMCGKAPCMEEGEIVEKEIFVTSGDYALCCVGIGKDVHTARKEAYGLIDQIEMPNSPMYRTDIGHRLEKQLPELQKMGYATEWKYEH